MTKKLKKSTKKVATKVSRKVARKSTLKMPVDTKSNILKEMKKAARNLSIKETTKAARNLLLKEKVKSTLKIPVDTKIKRATRELSLKERNTIFDNRLSSIKKIERNKMFKNLFEKSIDDDLRNILAVYNSASNESKDNLLKHYELNGSLYITAIFTGQTKLAQECAPTEDKKLFK